MVPMRYLWQNFCPPEGPLQKRPERVQWQRTFAHMLYHPSSDFRGYVHKFCDQLTNIRSLVLRVVCPLPLLPRRLFTMYEARPDPKQVPD